MKSILIVQSILLTLSAGCQMASPENTDRTLIPEERELATNYDARTGGAFGRTGLVLYSGSGVSREAIFEWHALGFDLSTVEHVGSSTGYHQWMLSNPTSFGIELIAGRNGNEFLVCGRNRRGKLVIEQWSLPENPGGWFSSNPNPETDVGVETALTLTTDQISGGNWIAPAQRSAQSPARKRELYLGDDIAKIGGLAIDPEGRFAILIDSDSKSIYRLLLDGSGDLTMLAGVSSYPYLADLESTSVEVFQDGLQGRVYAIGTRTFRGEGGVILADPNNDCIFDPPFWLSHGDVDTAFPEDIWLNVGS